MVSLRQGDISVIFWAELKYGPDAAQFILTKIELSRHWEEFWYSHLVRRFTLPVQSRKIPSLGISKVFGCFTNAVVEREALYRLERLRDHQELVNRLLGLLGLESTVVTNAPTPLGTLEVSSRMELAS